MAWAGVIFDLSTETFGSSFTAWLLAHLLTLFHISVSPRAFQTLHFAVRKLGHLSEYAIFSLLLYRCFRKSREGGWHAQPALWSIVVAGLYALTDEFHQLFVPGRTASLLDSGIDTVGAALGMLGLYGTERLFQGKDSKAVASAEANR